MDGGVQTACSSQGAGFQAAGAGGSQSTSTSGAARTRSASQRDGRRMLPFWGHMAMGFTIVWFGRPFSSARQEHSPPKAQLPVCREDMHSFFRAAVQPPSYASELLPISRPRFPWRPPSSSLAVLLMYTRV